MIILYFTKRLIDRGGNFLIDWISRNQLHFLLQIYANILIVL